MMIVIASVAVALVSFILYALERRSKSEPILWESAGKFTLLSGLITAGVVFATTTDFENVKEAVNSIDTSAIQDMFVGTPTF